MSARSLRYFKVDNPNALSLSEYDRCLMHLLDALLLFVCLVLNDASTFVGH